MPTTIPTDGGACRDSRVGSVKRFGPFDDIAAFYDCARGGIALEYVQGSFVVWCEGPAGTPTPVQNLLYARRSRCPKHSRS